MKKTITNYDISPAVWDFYFKRDELRKIAATHGIPRGRDKSDTATNLQWGGPSGVEFPITIEVK